MVEVGRLTAIVDGDISPLTSKLGQARSQATSSVAGIESEFRSKLGSGLSSSLSGGDFSSAGKRMGASLVEGVSSSFGPLGSAVGEVATAMGPAGLVAAAAVAGAAVIGSAASSAAMEWEAGMSRIAKTTGLEIGTTGFDNLSSDLQDLYSTLPTTRAEIQGVAAAAGSLGIEQQSIAGFTETALQMGSAFEIPAEQAAVSVGKIKSQLKSLPEGVTTAAEFANNFGSAVDHMGNTLNATESDILDFATRTTGSLSALGGGAYEIAGWGGVLTSVFPSAERAAGSFDALLTQLTSNEDSQAAAAQLLGTSTEEFMQAMSTDPSDTLLRIGSALEGLPADKLLSTSKALGGAYGMDALTKMVGHTEEWRDAINEAVTAGQKGESIGTSFAAGANNMKSSLQVLRNSIGAILQDMGGPINAALSPVITGFASGLNKVREIGENLWEPLTTGISPFTSAVSGAIGLVADLGGMSLDGLVTGSKAVNTAFQTGKAFVSAFKEEITEVVTESETFQTISGYIDDVSESFGELGEWAGETFDKIVSGLSDAIPTAISGAAGAVGTLMDKAGLGGLTDMAGGVEGFLGDVYENAAEKLGWSVSESTEEGMVEGTEAAQDDIQKTVEDAVGEGAKDAFEGVSSELANIMKNFKVSDTAALAILNNMDDNVKHDRGLTSTTLENGLQVNLRYNTDDGLTRSVLIVNGQEVAGPVYGWGVENTIPELFSLAGLNYNQGNTLDLTGKGGEAAIWRVTASQKVEFDLYTEAEQLAFKEQNQAIWDNFGEETATIISDNADFISKYGSDAAKEAMNAILDAFAHPDAAKFNAVSAAFKTLTDEWLIPGQGENLAAEFKAKILPQITDIKEFCKQQGEEMGQTITGAFSDSILSEDERALIMGMEPLIDVLLEEAPEAGEEAGLGLIKSFIEAVKSGASSGELDAIWDQIIQKSGDAAETVQSKLQEGTGMFYGDLLTKTHDWTEYALPGGGYIGPTEYYDDYIANAQGAADRARQALQNVEDIKVGISIDKSEVETSISGLSASLKAIPMDLNTTEAEKDILRIDATIETARIKPVLVDKSSAMATIAQIDAAASKPVTKIVYIQEMNTYGGSGGWEDDNWLSFADEGYVASPTLAVIGDRPGGEYVVGAARFEAAAAKIKAGGSPQITIHYSPIINGSSLSQEELMRVLEEHDEKLVSKIIEAKEWG